MKRILYQAYLTLAFLEGVIVLWFTLDVPSIESSTGLLDLPTSCLAVSAVTLVLVILFACLALLSFLNRRWLERVMRWLADRLIPGDRLLILTLILLGGLLVSIALCMLWQLPALQDYRWYSAIFKDSLHLYEVPRRASSDTSGAASRGAPVPAPSSRRLGRGSSRSRFESIARIVAHAM